MGHDSSLITQDLHDKSTVFSTQELSYPCFGQDSFACPNRSRMEKSIMSKYLRGV